MKSIKIYGTFFGIVTLFAWAIVACDKPEVGYLSDHIFYKTNPYDVQQGVTTFSSPIEGNGSTSPLTVELLAIRDADGNDAMEALTTPQSIVTYSGTVTYEDNTLEALYAKLSDSTVAPFHINTLGGRLEFSKATSYVDTGAYYVDVRVSNSAGVREITNMVNFNINSVGLPYTINYQAASTSLIGEETFSGASAPVISVNHDPLGENYIILKFVDKNGDVFNPANNEIIKRGDRPTFANWDPWYDEVKSDSGYVYQYPNVPSMPAFSDTYISGVSWSGGICYYRIAGAYTDIQMNVNPVFTIVYNLPGTYVVTIKLGDVERVE